MKKEKRTSIDLCQKRKPLEEVSNESSHIFPFRPIETHIRVGRSKKKVKRQGEENNKRSFQNADMPFLFSNSTSYT